MRVKEIKSQLVHYLIQKLTEVTVKAAKWVISMETMKEKADKIRLEFLSCTDEQLVYFSHGIYCQHIETVSEHVASVAAKSKESMPF